ncbi:unnamed protein product [Arctia plantaginis]|uniref:Uncharacterized protein n=1 Tax=Arctia plantaginis TaxID=874455 RepID=A0A8S0ZGT9_ARCPL|nr:unnamed protein product [Arctia plantaginis]
MFTNIRRALQWLGARYLRTLSEAAMMLLHLLLHVLIFHLLTAKGGQKDASKTSVQQALLTPKDKNYVLKYIEKCPEKGHYFIRDYSTNKIEPATCYLCFCQGDKTAVCWRRDNKRCNDDSFRSQGDGNRNTKTLQKKTNDTRIRRSPGFTDIFFRDASRDMFNKNTEGKQCKPYESSFSDDCPPADWCTGCTVCDCDANGRWDCHILSFCSDRARPRTPMPIMGGRKSRKHRTTTTKKVVKKPVTQPRKPKQKQQKVKQPLRYKRIAQKSNASKAMFKKRNIATHKRVHLHKKKETEPNVVPDDLAKEILKKMMTIVNKLVQKEIQNMTKLVAKRQQWFEQQQRKMYLTTLTPRIIGGTRKKWQKRSTEIEQDNKKSKLNLWQNRYKRDLSSLETNTHNSIVSSTVAVQKERPTDSTVLPIQSDIDDNSIDKNTKSITVMPLQTNTENDYYKYILATNIIPLIRNEIKNNDSVKPSVVIKTNKISTTDKTMTDRTELITEHKTLTVTEREKNIQAIENGAEKIETTSVYKKTTELPTTETGSTLVNTLQNTTNASTTGNKLVDDIVLNYVSNPYKYLPEVDPSENDIQVKKWPPVKIVKQKFTTTESLTEDPQKHISNSTIITNNNTNKVRRKDVKRITVSRKYNLLKALNFHKCPFLNKLTASGNETYTLGQPAKTPDVKNDLTKLLHKYNASKKIHKKIKKFSLIKYLRKLFNYVFRRKNRSDRFSRYHILETLCEHFGPCNIKSRDKRLLRSKLTDLKQETMTILKTVKIIKGLLILLEDSPDNNKTLSKKSNFGSSIQRLNSILKGNYGDSSEKPLTITKLVQIEYIKKNTQAFVKSVGKFATLLNEIIGIITKDADKPMQNNFRTHEMGKDPFKNLKDLLIKYNLVQNNFMKKMYDLVNSFENRNYEKPKVSDTRGLNSSVAIENFSRNILKNLRKLKHLAQTLNYNRRAKRETRDDDAIEYLLMLMEYLLKQNHPLDAAPANDGIDLLLEAIKNAPDIKTVRKKVLVNTPSGSDTTMITIPRNLLYRSTTDTSVADTESDSETTSNEDSETPKTNTNEETLKKKIDENKDLFDLIDEEKEVIDKYQFDRRAGAIPTITDFTTNVALYDDEENKTFGNSLGASETTPLPELANEEENFDKSTDHGNKNENGISDNPSNANNNVYENTENVNVYSNTVNNNYDMNTGYGNNDDTNAADGNVYMGNMAEGNIHSAPDNDHYNANIPKDLKTYDMKASYDFSKAVTEETVLEKGVAEERIKATEDRDKKIETVYTGEIDEEDTTHGTVSGLDSEVTTFIPQEVEIPKNKYISKEIKTLDSYDTEKLDKKSKLEWIEENFRREYSHYDEEKGKAHEEKRENIKINTPVTLAPSRTSAPEYNKKKPSVDVSMISNEVSDTAGKKKKSKINTEEVMFKKQMDLMHSLDYGTEKSEFDETESKDGNADEKDSENFPTYFV